MNYSDIRRQIESLGYLGYLRYGSHRLSYRTARLIGLKGVVLESHTLEPDYLNLPQGFSGRRVQGSKLSELAGEKHAISSGFAAAASRRGDWCYVIECQGQIASYGWYSTQPVEITEFRMQEQPLDYRWDNNGYVYMYKGYTAPEFRGARLHGYGMALSLESAVRDGFRGLVSFVEAGNIASLRSSQRIGYRVFGTCYVFRLFGRYFSFSTPGCRRFDFAAVQRSQ